jgi:hypothetical protein
MVLQHDIYAGIDYRYPQASGASQYDFNTGNARTVYRGKEPVEMSYPAVKINFLRATQNIGQGINSLYSQISGINVYAFGELEPVTITAYTHQMCMGDSKTGYHGKVVADSLIRRIEKRVRRYWPALLSEMEGRIYNSFPFSVYDVSDFQRGTERQGFELTFHMITTNKWDDLIGEEITEYIFEDAVLSGQDIPSLEAGQDYQKFHTISGLVGIN